MESGELTGTGLAHVGQLPRGIAKGPRIVGPPKRLVS
jgi:hypothetical protein